MRNFLLSPQAQESLRQISNYTAKNYGQQQNRKYLTLLRDKMKAAATSPGQGRIRGEIKQGYFSVQAGKHHIYYRVRDSHIEIIDVLHQSMEPDLHI